MPKRIPPLTDVQIRNLKAPSKEVKLFDGNGLFLVATPTGGKLWRFKYRFGGKEKLLSFGSYPHISLAMARQKREEIRDMLAKNIDPREAEKAEELLSETFEELAREWLAREVLTRKPAVHGRYAVICPRCGERLYERKPDSIARAWALVIAAFIFYIPANVLPIMKVTSMGKVQADTILSGVIYFIETGMWPIALVIFVASVFVPLLKLFILTYLLISLQVRSLWRPRDRTRLYRITEIIGRWSMVDIYVVTLMVALVKLGAIADIEVCSRSDAFCGGGGDHHICGNEF